MENYSDESLLGWAQERLANSERIAELKTGDDRNGWLEDAAYWRAIIAVLLRNPDILEEVLRA